jgi:hypothetical protein
MSKKKGLLPFFRKKKEGQPPSPVRKKQPEIINIDVDNPMSILAGMAATGNLPLEQMEKLMNLRDRMEADKAKKEFLKAKSDFQADCPIIEKTKSGWNNNYKYAPFEAIIKQIKNILKSYGFSYTFHQKQTEKNIEVTCTLYHISGHEEKTSLTAPWDDSGGKNVIQSIGSTVTYLKRYTLLDILGIGTADSDDDGKSYPESFVKDIEYNRKVFHYAIIGLLAGKVFGDPDREKFKAIYKAGGFKTIQDYQRNYNQTMKEKQRRENSEKSKNVKPSNKREQKQPSKLFDPSLNDDPDNYIVKGAI